MAYVDSAFGCSEFRPFRVGSGLAENAGRRKGETRKVGKCACVACVVCDTIQSEMRLFRTAETKKASGGTAGSMGRRTVE